MEQSSMDPQKINITAPDFNRWMRQFKEREESKTGIRGQKISDATELFPPDYGLGQVCPRPFVAIAIGHRASGKSGCLLRIQELLHLQADPYAVGMPAGSERFLPSYYGLVQSFDELPRGCVAYIPEAYRTFHARGSGRAQAALIGDLINLSRHRDQTLLLDVQNAAHLDRNIISEADMLLIKEPAPLSEGFERPQLRKYMDQTRGLFSAMKSSRRKRMVYVVAPGRGIHGQLFENRLPKFWTEGLSKAFSSIRPGSPEQVSSIRKPRSRRSKEAIAERKTRSKEMRRAGFSYAEIGDANGMSKAQASRDCNE